MPKYIVKGKTYDIPDDKVSGFETKYPDAKVEYHNDGKKYQIPLSKRGGFLKKYPNAFYGAEKPGSVSAQVIAEYDRYAGNEGHKPSALIGVTDRSTPFEPIKGFDGQDIVMSTERHLLPFEERAKLAAKDAERAANNPKNIYSTYIADKLREVDDELDKKRESLTLVPGASFIPSSAIGIAQRYGNQENKEAQDRYTSLHAAKIQLEEANKIIEAAKNNDESFLSSLGRGFKDKFFTVGNWDLGVTDIAYTSLLRKAVEKSEHDETLSPEEGRLLDAAATNMAVQGALSGQLGRGYKAGATTGASIPFMLEMLVNPISGAGNAMAKGLLKYGLKRFGRIATSKAAKVAGRLAGDALAATGMAATTGAGHVMAGAEQRMTGDINPEIKDGEIKYGGRENQTGALEAYAKSAADRGIENFSEMFFNAFSGGGKAAKSFIKEYAPVLAKLPRTKVGELISTVRNHPLAKELANRTQFHGIIGEHAEEIIGDLLRVPMGEASMGDITNVDKNIDTLLGLAPTSVAFGMLGLGGMAHEGYINRRSLKRFERGLNEEEKELFSELREAVLKGNDEVAKKFIKATLRNPELTPEQKRSYIFGTQELVKEKAAEDAKSDPVLEEVNREEIEANKIDTYRNYKRAERKANTQLPSDITPMLDENMDVDSFAKEKGLNEQQVSAINEFLDARSSYNAYEHEVNRKRNEAAASAREQAANDANKLTHEQRETVIEAHIDGVDGVAHIVGGNISFDEDGVLDKAHSDDTIYYLDEDGNKKMVSAENVSSVLSEIPSDELIERSVQQAIAQFDEQERASLETPDIPVPGKGERIMLDGSNYVIENADNDMPGNFLAVKLNERGEIDPLGEIKSISPDDYYTAKEREFWEENEQKIVQQRKVLPDGRMAIQTGADDTEVSFDILDQNGSVVDSDSSVNLPEKEFGKEVPPSSEESKVSEEPIEDAEQKKKRVIDSMPKKKDGAIDYDALTPQQQYEYTSVTESVEEAAKDLSEDISERRNRLAKMEEQLNKVTGTKKIKLRDTIREHRVKLNELETFYKEVAPVKGNDTSGLRNDRDYIEWVAENSDDAKELSDAYNSAKDLASHEQALMPWQKELLGRKINPDSFRRFGDRNHITGGLAKAWLNKNGEEVDTLAQELSAFGVDVSEQDIIDFVLANPGNYVSQISEDMRMLSARFSEVASKEVGMPIGGLESTTGKLYLKMKEAQVRLDALTDAQQQEFRDAVNTDAVDFIASSENDISDAYEDVITEDYARAYDETMNERGSEEADEELISKAEEGNPELYYGGFTAEELDEIYSKIENGTERQETDIVEDGIEALSENVPPTKDGGSEEINRIPNESGGGENKGIELDSGGNSLNSTGDSVYLHSNQPEHENDEVPESIPQGEHRTEAEENGGLEEATNQLRRRIEEASRNASESERSGNAQQEVNRSIESQAKDSGLWTPIEKISNIGNPFLSGNENDTYLNKDEGVVYKVNNLMNSGSLPNLFSRIDFHNRFFPDTKYELVGFTGFGNGNSVYPIYKQRYIPNAEFASVEDINNYMQSLGFRQTGEAKYSDGDIIISDLRPRNVLKDADGDIYVVDAEFAEEKNTSPEFAAPQINKGENVLDYATRIAREKEMHDVRQSVDTTPTEKQKEAGNYKKGHLKIDGYDVSIENPKGSERSGKDANGQSWSVTMNNDYGYIRGTEGVDGDQIDVFLSDNPSSGKVFVVDQVKEDGFFDEHKVMYGFDSVEEAREAYLANYSPGWKGLGSITEVSKDEFKKWVNSSKRKTKPFSGYKSVKREEAKSSDVPYSIHPSQYTTKKGKVLDMRLVTFQSDLSKEQQRAAKEFAKVEKGWYDAKQGGFMMRSEESAKRLADTILNNKDALSNAQPVSLDDMRRATALQQANTEKPISEVNNKKGNVSDQAINPSKNRLVTDERYAELRERMRKKLGGQMNIGIDPEILAIGTEMAVYHIEKGAREFKAYAKAMISDLGDAIRPYLKAFYNGARNLPEVEDGGIAIDMTPYEEVRLFDVTNFDKLGVDIIATAENLTRESSVEQEVEIAQERIKKIRSVKKETKKKNVTSQPPSEMGLFDSLFDNKTNNDNGLQRTDAERSEGVSANGNQHEQGLSRGTETGSESEQQGSRGADLGGERTGDAVDRAVRPRLSDTITEKKNTHNNHSERGKDHAPTSVDARIDANIKAIELAKLLFESGEQATEKQMQILRKFSGWGGLGKAFSEGTYYDPNHIAKQLRELLGEEAYQTYIHNAKPRIKAFIKDAEKRIEDNSRYLEAVQSAFPDGKFTEIIIGKHRFASVEAMEDFFKDHNKSVLAEMKQMKDGEIAGEQKRELTIKIGDFSFVVTTNLTRQTVRDGATLFNDVKRKMHYSCPELGIEDIPVRQNLLRNAIEDITHNVITGRDFAERLEAAHRNKKHNDAELEQLLSREGNPFEYEAELEQAQTQYEEFSELMKKELEEKEAKYAKMDADVTAADNLSTADETDELERDGDGEYNDDEVSFENDHISKVLGKSRHTRKRRREFAERERQRMVVRVETLAKKLHLDNVEVVTDASQLEGKKQRAKGFYSKSTGKITIVIPNHVSTFDVEQTLLHEAVAHYGLRQLFGEHFDTFLDNVFNSAEESVRKNISDLSATNGWDTRKATEEYLASLAENTAFENINASWWSKIKSLFLDMLHKIGFENFNGITLTDNELRYILWRSYENLAEPSRYRSILGEVKDIAKRYELNVGNYESSISRMDKASDSSDVMFREDTPSDMTREAYEESLKGQAYKAQEAYQDSMLALKRLQDVIENHSGRKLKGFENAYMDENHLSSKSHYESEVYGKKFFKPMLEAVGALIKEGASYDDVVDYMMAKHGLERNEVFAMRDAENAAAKKYDKEVNALRKKFDEGELSVEEELNELIATRKDYVDSEFEKNRGKDYSGLTALTEAEDYEAAAKDIVSSFENAHDTADLWDKVNKATKESLRKSYESGMMSKATFDKVSKQFKFYIPLRGWKKDTASDIYEYFNTETSSVNPVLKFSKGRKSLADDPIAVIGNMAESTILQGNRNLMKQKFMNMAINHRSDLLSVSEAWYVKDPSSGNWVLSYPNIEDGDSPSVIAQKVSEHEERMLEMKKEGNATKSNEGLSIDYRISKQQAKEHAVNVKRNGKDYFVYVNGNPRAAQAVNGLLNPDAENNKLFTGISRVNRQLAANFTTRNPAFVMTNLSRDLIFSTSNVLVKEDLKYSLNYIKNIEKSMRIVAGHLSGKSPNPLFEEFLSNGGETGYTALHNIDQYKRMIKKEMRSITGKSDYMASVKACANFFSTMNRWAEDVSRFNAYMTSREAGRSVMQSISDAKEVTVNFNKKGAGYKTGGVFGVSSGLMRNLFLFFNASVQSLANFTRLAANHKKGFGVLIGGFTTAGFITPMLNGLLISLMGGDDDYYGNLTEWERRNNLCIYAGDGKFIKRPLPIELRAFYGIGEMAYQETIGNGNNGESIAYDAINQIADLLPLNPIANNGDIVTAIMPDVIKPFWQINQNKDFTGKPIYRENDFNKTMPEWTKTYRGTSKVFVDLSEWLNELGGGDKYKSGGYWADWNPAKAEHVLESYFGGMATTIVQTGKTLYAGVESAMNGKKSDNLILRNVPVINRFASDASDDKSAFSKVNSRYYRLNEEYEDTRKNLKGYIKEASTGDVKYLNKLSKLQNSKEYEVFRVFGVYKKQIDKLMKMAKDAPGGVLPQGLEDEMIRLKKEAIEKVEKIQ